MCLLTEDAPGLCSVPVLDRVGLIIEIFAQRARSREARLQVSRSMPWLPGWLFAFLLWYANV